ncbi:MAG TPA: hypothetical protein VL728_19620 [Cyclobacteriaceae bacterium]|jgi:hypothetical protein|nr:hypothetical protein [Cyclobacteriaceae bacterium]
MKTKTELDMQFEYKDDKSFARHTNRAFLSALLLAISIALGALYVLSLFLR